MILTIRAADKTSRMRMLAKSVVLITFIIIPLIYPQSCWEENQSNHQMSDYKSNSDVFQYLAFAVEEDIPGTIRQSGFTNNKLLQLVDRYP